VRKLVKLYGPEMPARMFYMRRYCLEKTSTELASRQESRRIEHGNEWFHPEDEAVWIAR
jgi:hypothetical protein